MSAQTSIEWTNRTWSPARGCSRVSEGCRHCYAERMAARFPWGRGFASMTAAGPKWTGRVELVAHAIAEPLGWREPGKVFISTTDPFHERLTAEEVAVIFGAMAAAPRQTFQVLTKRAARMREWFRWYEHDHNPKRFRHPELIEHAASFVKAAGDERSAGRLFKAANAAAGRDAWPLPNVWLGVSVEDQATADARIPLLLQTPAVVRFVSYEPALGPVRFDNGEASWLTCSGTEDTSEGQGCVSFAEDGEHFLGIDWVIVGGESGPGARPFDVAWARSTVAQCKAASVPVFVKQLGARPYADKDTSEPDCAGPVLATSLYLRDRKGGDMAEWQSDLQIREFPA